jgi:hypothetical protein
MICEQQVGGNRLATVMRSQGGEIRDDSLLFVSRDESIVEPAPLQNVG